MTDSDSAPIGASWAQTARPRFRPPGARDGPGVSELVVVCPPLDQNSRYCHLLQCMDFADTCALAEVDGEVVGWISGYRQPRTHETLFIWQVAVHARARGLGLARSMLDHVLSRPSARGVTTIKATITSNNEPSWRLFRAIAGDLSAPLASEAWLAPDDAPAGDGCATERLVTIGPFSPFGDRPSRRHFNPTSRKVEL